MKRLLMVATVAPTIRAFLLPYADHFRALGWQVDAMASGADSCDTLREHFDHVWEMKWSRNPFAPSNLLSCRPRVRRIVEAEDYDLVHVHTPVAAFVSRLALSRLRREGRVKVIYTAHGFHFYRGRAAYQNFAFKTLERMGGKRTDRLVVMNEEDFAAAKRLKLVPSSHLTYMPGIGVNTSAITPQSVTPEQTSAVKSELGLKTDEHYLLMVAELIARKRPADVLRAFSRLSQRDSKSHLVLAGEGPLRADLEQMAEQLGLNGRVHFLGFRKDVPILIRGSAALILASSQEGLPRSIMEAMCMGIPVIGSDIRGTRDLLQGDAGILTPCGDIDGLASAMHRTLTQTEEMAQLGQNARRRIEDFDLKKVIAMHEALYADALKESDEQCPVERGSNVLA